MTRTDQGYAEWKEHPKWVAEARVQAKGEIGRKKIKAAILGPFIRLLDGLIAESERRAR